MAAPQFDMTVCTKKCKCPTQATVFQGAQGLGLVYECEKPCPDGDVFVYDLCECLPPCTGLIAIEDAPYDWINGIAYYTYPLADVTSITFSYDAFSAANNFTLSGAVNYTTGCTTGRDTVFLPVDLSINYVRVTVEGCDIYDRVWEFELACNG